MEHDTHATKVLFRVWKGKSGGVLALFPEIDFTCDKTTCQSYEHVGQHGGANYHGCIARTRPATPQEYNPLAEELTRIGYNLDIRKRYTK